MANGAAYICHESQDQSSFKKGISERMVKHRAANLTYRSTLTRFGLNPSLETIVYVRAALKELYVLKGGGGGGGAMGIFL